MPGRTPQRSTAGSSLCSCTALRKATRRISQLYDAALSPSGLKITQRAILAQIKRSQPATVGTLAAALVMDAGALAHTLKPLERDGFVRVSIDASDRRNRLVELTPLGQAKLTETDALWAAAEQSFESALGRARSKALRESLQILFSEEFSADFTGDPKGAASGP